MRCMELRAAASALPRVHYHWRGEGPRNQHRGQEGLGIFCPQGTVLLSRQICSLNPYQPSFRWRYSGLPLPLFSTLYKVNVVQGFWDPTLASLIPETNNCVQQVASSST